MSKENKTESRIEHTKKPYTSTYRATLVVDFSGGWETSSEDILEEVAGKMNVLVGVRATVNVFGGDTDMIIKVNTRG